MYQFSLASHFTSRGSPLKANEDGFLITPTHFMMIDGATGRAKDERRFVRNNAHQTEAAWLVAEVIRHYPEFKSDEHDLRNHIRTFGQFLNQHFLSVSDLPADIEKSEMPCAAASFAQLDPVRQTLQIAGLADTEAIIVFHDGHFEHLPADPRSGASEEITIKECQAYIQKHGGTLQEAMQATLPAMRDRASVTNTSGNRGVLNVWDVHSAPDECFSNYKIYDASKVERIIMYTDGMDSRYNLFTPQSLIRLSQENGFQHLIEQMRMVENSDPLGLRYPRVKTSDDATIACALIRNI